MLKPPNLYIINKNLRREEERLKFNLNEILGMQKGLDVILEKELPAKTAYWLARFLDKAGIEFKAFEKARLKLVERYAEKDKEGKPKMKEVKGQPQQYDLTDASMKKFNDELADLGKEEFEIDFKPIKLEQLGDIKLKPIVLVQLGKIIEE